MKKIIYLVSLSAMAAATPALADTATDSAASAGNAEPDGSDIVVTATRVPTDIGKIGSSITVITAKELENRQTRFVLDALQTTPGLSVAQFGARGTDSSLKLRGQNPEGTFVLIDGVEVSDPSRSQTAFDFSQLLATNIERIEVLRGSQSVLYGSEAIGGVINIVSKRGSGPLTGSIFGEGGSYGTYLLGGQIRGGLANDRFGYSVDLQYLHTDGFSAADENLPGNSEGEKYKNFSSSGRFDYQFSDDWYAKAVYRYAEGTLNYDACGGPYCDDPDVGDDFLQYSGRLSTGFSLLDGALRGEFGASYARNEREGFDNGADSYFYYGDRTKFDFQGSYAIDADNVLVFGAETKNDRMRSDAVSDRISVRNNGFYALYQLGLFESLYLSAGVRIDDHETFGTFDTYRGTAAYNIAATGTKLKGSYSTGFRAPSLFELYGRCCGDPLFGNIDLKPETSKSWDLGIEQKLADDTLQLEVVYFQIDTRNKINFIGFGDPEPNYFNVPGRTRSKGVEASLAWNPNEALSVRVAYTNNQVRAATGERLQNRPRHYISGNINYTFLNERANLNLTASYWSDTLDTDFSTFPSQIVKLDNPVVITLAGRLNLFEKTELTGRIENLLDEKYQTEAGYGTAGLSFYAGIRQSF
ncbi:MAG: TonB-dependent receptor [Novosphingobium sp.]